MKLLMMLSNAFSISAGAHEFVFLFSSSRCCGVVFGVVVDGGGRVVVWGFSSVLTVDTAVFRRGLGGEETGGGGPVTMTGLGTIFVG